MSRRKKQSLLEYADELVETLRSTVPDAIKSGDAKAVHQARVTTRRLKAAADVFRSVSSGSNLKPFAKLLKRLRNNLGDMRDLEVMTGHLDELKSKRFKPGVDWMREQLSQQHAKAKRAAADDVDVAKVQLRLGAWWGVRQEWTDAGEEGLETLLAESLHLQLDCFIEHADGLTGRAEAEVDKSLRDPHGLRIAGKSLRYTLELAIAGGHPLPSAIVRAFKKMQDALGLWHDYVVLSDQMLDCAVGQHDVAVMLPVLDMAKHSLKSSQRELERFSQLWRERGDSLAVTIRQAFPLSHPVPEISEPQKDHDPPDSPAPPADQATPPPGETSAA